LFNLATREAVQRRLGRIAPGAKPRWGSMSPERMVVHLIDGFKMTFGEHATEFHPSLFSTPLGRWLAIDAPIPWPKGKTKAPEVFFRTSPGPDFEADRATLISYIDRFGGGREQTWGSSPLFGALSPEQWARLNYRHCDHHLRQFGA